MLNGLWDIAPGTAESPRGEWCSKVPVPSLVDCASPPYDWQAFSYHWYHLEFRVNSPSLRETATLRIGRAMFGTRVWLNGTPLGEDIACYTSQEYDAAPCLRHDGPNHLTVRVGLKETLPPESAVGKDQERQTFIPGIWGDVSLTLAGNPRIALVQVIPRNRESTAEAVVTLRNTGPLPVSVKLVSRLREHASGRAVGRVQEIVTATPGAGDSVHAFNHSVDPLIPWSPDRPFLYEHSVEVIVEGDAADTLVTRFGMREFRIQDGGFFLNGKRIFLKGGNIAFHRFLSDADRGLLPWNEEWIRKLLIEIPRRHNFNFFRAHIGQMYDRWYDIADEGGMLLQNEWMFWTTTGTEAQITKEFTRWLQDNWNHPSIIIWDPLNESSDPVVQDVVVPKMKRLDPTRPWESVDFVEEHPYIYSLGPVLNAERFGFTRSLSEIEDSRFPKVLNEFLWWWLDKENNPTVLTAEVVERWLGKGWTKEGLVAHQSFLAGELIELFRRMRVDAIQPFVYSEQQCGAHGELVSRRHRLPGPQAPSRDAEKRVRPVRRERGDVGQAFPHRGDAEPPAVRVQRRPGGADGDAPLRHCARGGRVGTRGPGARERPSVRMQRHPGAGEIPGGSGRLRARRGALRDGGTLLREQENRTCLGRSGRRGCPRPPLPHQ
jgi:beta-galactosidase